jgi:antitoxin component of RelBE/YafQ-DinJ toxin-antitoxin module
MSDYFIGFRTTKEIKDKAKNIAKKKGMSLSSLLRRVIMKKRFWLFLDEE